MSADATQVTGSPLAGPGVPRPGTVLAERYELVELVDADGPAVGFRALDQESERQVLVRILAGPGVHTDVCDAIVRHLRGLVGIGGRYLASLLDADREGRSPFTVEPWPRGTPLSAILDARRSRGEALGAREALPVIAQLSAALRALPEGLHHGDVRAERVWLDTDGLRLTGPFLLAALPPDELAERIEKLGPGAVAYPPEARSGLSGPASDLWGVGSIAWEALTGRSPDPSGQAPEVQGSLRTALAALLADAPEQRPADLDELLRAIARRADLSVPHLDPEPHQPPTALVTELEGGGTEPSAGPARAASTTKSDEDSLDPRLVRAALGVAMDVEDRSGPNDTAKLPSVSASLADSLDPRLVRAALDVSLDSSSEETALPSDSGSHGLDPRLVRAALGVEMDSAESVEMELDEEELHEAPVAPARPAIAARPPGAARPAPGVAPKPTPAPRPAGFPAPSPKSGFPPPGRAVAPRPAAAPGPRPPAARPRAAPLPGPAAPPPRPRPAAPAEAPARATPAPDARPPASRPPSPHAESPARATPAPDARPAPRPSPALAEPPARATPAPEPRPPAPPAPMAQPPARATPAELRVAPTAPATPPAAAPAGASMAGFEQHEEGTAIVEAKHRRYAPPPPKRRSAGVIIVVIALLIAVAIVGVGFLIAGQRRAEAARARELDRMLEQLRQRGAATPD